MITFDHNHNTSLAQRCLDLEKEVKQARCQGQEREAVLDHELKTRTSRMQTQIGSLEREKKPVLINENENLQQEDHDGPVLC